jgi:regulator of protease activity HflC (stomatin/prohibitin superfamily)
MVIVTARQTQSITDQYMVTKDRVVVGYDTLVVYRIPDVVKAIGRINWDVDTTVCDITQAAVATVIATRTYDEMMQGMADGTLRAAFTRRARKELRQFGVYVSQCKLANLAPCRVYRFLTSGPSSQGLPTVESDD